MLYFAFGSNMDPVQMAERCPGSRYVGIARLPGRRLAFSRYSAKREGGVADVVPYAGGEVWGVLWELGDEDFAALDLCEGFTPGGTRNAYERSVVEVHTAEGPVEAALYQANPEPNPPPPSRAYLRHLIEGARAHALPAEYQETLSRIECTG